MNTDEDTYRSGSRGFSELEHQKNSILRCRDMTQILGAEQANRAKNLKISKKKAQNL